MDLAETESVKRAAGKRRKWEVMIDAEEAEAEGKDNEGVIIDMNNDNDGLGGLD